MNIFLEQIEKNAGLVNSTINAAKAVGGAIKADAGALKGQLQNVGAAAKANGIFTKGTASTIKAVGRNKALQAGTAAAAIGAGAGALALRGREKQACVQRLLDSGIDFDTAVELTKQAEQELYGN